ncbi:aconitate hydratase, cytoplasmic-like [Amphibalanus amphitrite]|uniref:aconitate hydratase, cytoplasmic-like n=1 Tax=Amphibalanus amphitrite TaxID=1232801 RepID=UPI001C905308|nr:aconitate hydratase, cytoplasmic-like [Amphibalanus amphitrite]
MACCRCSSCPGQSAKPLGLGGRETFSMALPSDLAPRSTVTVTTDDGRSFPMTARLETQTEISWYRHGGLLRYMVRQLL